MVEVVLTISALLGKGGMVRQRNADILFSDLNPFSDGFTMARFVSKGIVAQFSYSSFASLNTVSEDAS